MTSMRPGILYLTERSADINPNPNQVELDPVSCLHCGKTFKLFTPKDWKEEEGVTDLGLDIQIKDLRERAQRAIDLDCAETGPEDQPRRPGHPSPIILLESGSWAV
jgi:hypothetical protein